MFKFVRPAKPIDELAAKVRTPEELAAQAPTGVDALASQKPESPLVKANFISEDDWKKQKEKHWVEQIAQGDIKIDQANLSKSVYKYVNRITYPDVKVTINGEKDVPLGWTDEEIEKMKEIEESNDPKYKDMIKW